MNQCWGFLRRYWGLFPHELQKQAVADYFSVELILQFCSENKGKQTCELLNQEKLSLDMRESGRGLFWSFLDIHLPWMQTVSYLMLWGESQNLQKFGSVPANIYILLILILGQAFPRDIVTVEADECDADWGRRVSRKLKGGIQMLTSTIQELSLSRSY